MSEGELQRICRRAGRHHFDKRIFLSPRNWMEVRKVALDEVLTVPDKFTPSQAEAKKPRDGVLYVLEEAAWCNFFDMLISEMIEGFLEAAFEEFDRLKTTGDPSDTESNFEFALENCYGSSEDFEGLYVPDDESSENSVL